MKKSILALFLLFISLSYAQPNNRWSAYGFNVSVENEVKLMEHMNEYFSNHKTDGTTVSLYKIMYAPSELQMTHTVVISGSVDSMSENYDMSNIDDEWVEFVTQVDKIVEPVFQGNGGRNFIFEDENKTYPYSVVTILDADNENLRKWRSNTRTLRTKYPRTKSSFSTGWISVGGPANGANAWFVNGYQSYRDYLTSFNDRQKFFKDNPDFVNEREELNEKVDYSKFDMKMKFMRFLVKSW